MGSLGVFCERMYKESLIYMSKKFQSFPNAGIAYLCFRIINLRDWWKWGQGQLRSVYFGEFQPSRKGGTRSLPLITPLENSKSGWQILEGGLTRGFWALRTTFAKLGFYSSSCTLKNIDACVNLHRYTGDSCYRNFWKLVSCYTKIIVTPAGGLLPSIKRAPYTRQIKTLLLMAGTNV